MEGQLKRFSLLFAAMLLAFASINFIFGQLSAAPAGTDGVIRYVDGATGTDPGTCRDPAFPCKTLTHVLKRALDGDTVRVAQGTYVENITISRNIRLEGGYEASNWTRDIENYETIIDGTNGRYVIGDWDGRAAYRPTVIKDGEQFRIWYDGLDVLELVRHVGTATSADGKAWTKYNKNPVLSGDSGAWDEFNQHSPFVMKDNGLYKMWYQGTQIDGISQMGYATSADGLQWTKYGGNPVLKAGPEEYDQSMAGSGPVLLENGTHKLWYDARGNLGRIIAYATSTDGINWTKVGPVFLSSDSGWDQYAIVGPSVLKLGEVYWMWYTAGTDSGCAIGAATSSDGLTWTRVGSKPVLGNSDSGCVGNATVIDDGGLLKMWYETYDDDAPWRAYVNYAESSDGITWTEYSGNPVLLPGELGQVGVPVVVVDQTGPDTLLDGFTIRNGFAPDGAGVSIWDSKVTVQNSTIKMNQALYSGGGIRASANTYLTATNNVIYDNHAMHYGGGGIIVDYQATAAIIENVIYDNSAGSGGGGIRSYRHMDPLAIVGNEVFNNESAWGGGIAVDDGDGDVLIEGNDVYANECLGGNGGGISVNNTDPSVVIVDNNVYGNAARSGGGIDIYYAGKDKILIDSNDIRDNRITESWATGGISIDDFFSEAIVSNNVIAGNDNEGLSAGNFTTLLVVNNTIVNNGADGMDLYAWPAPPPYPFTATLANNIVTHHSECAVHAWNDAQVIARYNDFWNNGDWENCYAPSGTNISKNPRFINRTAGDFRLWSDSPAIDAGTYDYAPLHDIDGNYRPFGSGFDMGAYEYPPYRWRLPLVIDE